EELESPQKADDNSVNKQTGPHPTSWEESASSQESTQVSEPSNKPAGESKPPKKTTKAELAAQKAVQEREEVIRRVGKELLRARQARSLSIDQLHRQTLVPPNHIAALEIGRLDQLPEDVYIRGFIRRLGAALGLDGVALAASIPEPDPVKSVIPSWYNSIPMPGLQLNSMHLYLGYTALIAGAVGGLSFMSQQNEQGASVVPEQPNPSQSSISPKAERTKPISKPGLKTSKAGVTVGADISPPEALQF
ncbi:MAG TPA: helix-turn-helix domain-containing protein, partial [Coleofasciculaceae cyanobacterium]